MLNITKKVDILTTILHEAAYNLFLQYHGFLVMCLVAVVFNHLTNHVIFLISNGDTLLDTFFNVFLASYYSK